jgi:hypothetical protein
MLDVAHVQESLRRLSATHADVFGANGHHFQLNSVLDDMDILAFEQRHGILLQIRFVRVVIEAKPQRKIGAVKLAGQRRKRIRCRDAAPRRPIQRNIP